jgi:hypothetical protein
MQQVWGCPPHFLLLPVYHLSAAGNNYPENFVLLQDKQFHIVSDWQLFTYWFGPTTRFHKTLGIGPALTRSNRLLTYNRK